MKAIPKPRPGGIVRFGKQKVRRDERNLMFATLLKAPPVLPTEYDFDVVHHGIPTPMFGNDQYGDCVMAARAHQTLRFELLEQKKVLSIIDKEVLAEYFKETGGADSGAAALLVDGVDTIHRELTTAQRVAYGLTGERTPRACHDDLAAIWDAWIWAWRASPIDCLATARRGAPHEDVDAAPETDGPITSLEMGADVEIELRATLNRRAAARPTKSRRGAIVHHAYVVKDRTRTLNGRHFAFKDLNDYKAGDYRAVWKAIGPALAATGRSGVLRGESLARTSRDLFPAPGEGGFADATHRRAVAIEEIQASLRALWPGETADEKRLRMLVTYTLFQARSWTAIGALPVETLETAWNTLEEFEVSADGVKVTDDADVVEALAAAATRASSMRSEAVPV